MSQYWEWAEQVSSYDKLLHIKTSWMDNGFTPRKEDDERRENSSELNKNMQTLQESKQYQEVLLGHLLWVEMNSLPTITDQQKQTCA